MSVSIVGDGFYQVALAWQVYLLSDAPTALSIVGASATLPSVALVLFAGVWSDQFERRRVLIVSDLLRGISVALTGALALSGRLELWHLIALSVIYGIGQALFGPAFTALVPDLVPQEELPQATAIDSVVRPLGMNVVGPAVGGLLITATGPGPAFIIDGTSFAVSITALALLRPHPITTHASVGVQATLTQLTEGLVYVRAHTWLWATLVAACVSLLFFMGPLRVLLPYIVKNQLGGSASDLGIVFAIGGIGSILASLDFSQRGMPRRPIMIMFVSWAVAVAFVAGFGFVTAVWQAAGLMIFVYGLSSVGLLIWGTLLGTRVPRELLGRVSSLDWMLSMGLVPISYVATGPLAELIGVSQTMVLAGVVGGAIFVVFLFLPGLLETDRASFSRAR